MTPWDLFAAAAITGAMANGDPRDCAVMAAEAADLLMAERRKRMADDVRGEADTMAIARDAMSLPDAGIAADGSEDEDDAIVVAARGKGRCVTQAVTRARRRTAAQMIMAGMGLGDVARHLGVSYNGARMLATQGLMQSDAGLLPDQLVAKYRDSFALKVPAHVVRARETVAARMARSGHKAKDIASCIGVSQSTVFAMLARLRP